MNAARDERHSVLAEAAPEQLRRRAGGDVAADVQELERAASGRQDLSRAHPGVPVPAICELASSWSTELYVRRCPAAYLPTCAADCTPAAQAILRRWTPCLTRTRTRRAARPRAARRAGPLAARARPADLREFVGQAHLLGPGSALRNAIEQGRVHSMLLHGPPGSGKTTLARIVGAGSGGAYEELSAVDAGRAEVRAVIERADHRRRTGAGGTDPVPRRDPPLQQGPAGRAAPGRRGGPAHPDRGDDREPGLRGQRRPAVAGCASTP